jgi:hypothetical protein
LLDKRLETIKQQQASSQPGPECLPEQIIAPFSATIRLITKKEQEYTDRGKPLVVLVKDDAPVMIEAYLSKDYLRYLHEGKEMEIEFTDKQKSKGQIYKIESTSSSFPAREWDGYDPVSTRIRAILKPIKKADDMIWKKYDRMQVNVKGTR